MYVVVLDNSYVHQLVPLAKHDFAELSGRTLTGVPVYFYESASGRVSVWPLPEASMRICRLEPQIIHGYES